MTLYFAFPLSVRPDVRVMSVSPDTNLFLWTLAWDTHAFTHQPLAIFDANIYYPERNTLAYSENLIGSAFFAAPVLWITDNPVLAMNVVALLSCILSGAGASLLARRLGVSAAGATLAGLVFAFSPPRFFRIGQPHLNAVQWVPFGLALLHSYLDAGRPRDLRLAAAFFTLQALTTGHGAVFLTIAMLGLVAFRVAMGEPIQLGKRVRDLGVPGALLLLPAVLLAIPYLTVQREMGLRRSLENWAPSWPSFVASPSHLHAWALSLLPGRHLNEMADAFLFPGYIPLLLAVAAVAWRSSATPRDRWTWRTRAWTMLAAILESAMAVALALALWVTAFGPFRLRLGPTTLLAASSATRAWIVLATSAALRVAMASRVRFAWLTLLRRSAAGARQWRLDRRSDAATFYALLTLLSVWLAIGPPFGLWPLVYWLPGMNFIRVPSRFMVLALLGVGVLAAIGFDRLTTRLAPPRRAAWALLVAVLLVAEFAAPLRTVEYRVEQPAIDRWLDGLPKPFVVAEVPLANPRHLGPWERRHTAYMLHATAHWQKTVAGYSGMRPARHVELYKHLTTFPDERSIGELRDLGVTYVVVHTAFYGPGEWARVEAQLTQFQSSLALEHVEGEGRVYSIRRAETARRAGSVTGR